MQTTPNRIKCSSFEIPMLSHIHIIVSAIEHNTIWHDISYQHGMVMWYQREWECHTYVVWECHTRWNGNVIPVVWECHTRWNGNPMGSYHGDETIPYHVESYQTRPYHEDGIMESYHTMGMEYLQDFS